MKPAALYKGLCARYKEAGVPVIAEGQRAYMRHKFEYYGLKKPVWIALWKIYFQEKGFPKYGEGLEEFVQLCYASEYREMQYSALMLLEKTQKESGPELIDLFEELILTHSWWDTVDWISKLVGRHFMRFPEQIKPVTQRWMDSSSFWLQRVAIIFQLAYKDKTDQKLLFRYILRVASSKEFFLQKASGWALRQYARTAPDEVQEFVATHPLSALTKREALKHLLSK